MNICSIKISKEREGKKDIEEEIMKYQDNGKGDWLKDTDYTRCLMYW